MKSSSDSPPRSILITGCSSGIGWHVAKHLRRMDWRVFATARRERDLVQLRDHGLEAIYLDYTEEVSIKSTARRVGALTGGTLYAVFNNGGFGQPGAVEDLPTRALREQFEVNFFGWHTLTRALIPAMRLQGSGRIIQCSSVLGNVGLMYRGAYVASKFALEGLSEALRLELTGSGVHVVSIRPGPIFSRFNANARAALIQNIDWENSAFRKSYAARYRVPAFDEDTPQPRTPSPYTLGPDAILKAVLRALEARKPRPVYNVTTATRIMDFMGRVLTSGGRARFLHRVSTSEE